MRVGLLHSHLLREIPRLSFERVLTRSLVADPTGAVASGPADASLRPGLAVQTGVGRRATDAADVDTHEAVEHVARAAGVNVETLRYYERRGLLRPSRALNGYRSYDAEAARRVRFIRRAQALGFSLNEIDELLALRARPGKSCADVRRRAEAKVAAIEHKLRALRAMRKALGRLVEQCAGRGPVTGCPILESLAREERA